MESLPSMPLAGWQQSKDTLHRFLQIVGKIRLAASFRRNHWWNVPFHLTGRGLTTRPMRSADGDAIFTIDFDFIAHLLVINHVDGRAISFPLVGQSVAGFHDLIHEALDCLDVRLHVARDAPFDLLDSSRPFGDDVEHHTYEPASINRYWRILSQVNLVLEEFSARFSGKISPVHHFWHTMDIAATRFSDRHVDQPAEADSVTREAYSREVISSGFWFGDDKFPEPAFYSYAAPEPEGLSQQPLQPSLARWVDRGTSHLAILTLEDARAAQDPRAAILDFYESSYQAGARLAGWDACRLASPGGITDPHAQVDN